MADSTSLFDDPATMAWLQFGLKVMESQKQGQFKLPPMSPQQQQMFSWAMGILQGTPSSSAMALPILGYDLGHPSTIDVNALKEGKVGYTPQGHMSAGDLAKILQGTGGSGAPQPQPQQPQSGDTVGSGPTGVAGDPFGHITSPAGSGGDPFGYMNNLDAGSLASGNYGGMFDSNTMNAIKSYASQYGKSAAEIAMGFFTGNPIAGLKGVYDAWKAHNAGDKGNQNPNGYQIDPVNGQYTPGRFSQQREQWNGPTYQQQMGQQFMANQNYNLGSAPGQIPSGQDPGFGYGWDVSNFVNGQNGNNPPRGPAY